MIATDEILKEKHVGIGDDVVVTGLFSRRHGTKRNIPIVRGGMIAAMPGEPLIGEGGEEYQAYLIEKRSTGGLSGSPVFVSKEWFADPKDKTPNLGIQLFSSPFFLIGVIQGTGMKKISQALQMMMLAGPSPSILASRPPRLYRNVCES